MHNNKTPFRVARDMPMQSGGPKLADNVHVLAANLNRLMEHHKALRTGLGSNAGLAKAAKVSSNTVGRLRRGDGSVTILKLSKIAKALKVQVWELTHPGFTPDNHLEVVVDQAERNLLEVFRGKPPPTQH